MMIVVCLLVHCILDMSKKETICVHDSLLQKGSLVMHINLVTRPLGPGPMKTLVPGLTARERRRALVPVGATMVGGSNRDQRSWTFSLGW